MELSVVRPKTFTVKMNIHCKSCEKKVKRILKNINGVHSIDHIDSEQGKVTVSGTVDPQTLITELQKSGKIRAEVLLEQQNNKNNNHNNMQIVEAKPLLTNVIQDDPHMAAQLHQLSEIQGLKNVELTYSKTVKLTFNGDKVEVTSENINHTTKKIIADDSNGQAKNHGSEDGIWVGEDGTSHAGLPRVCAVHGQYGHYGQGWPGEACGCTSSTPPCPPPPWTWAWPQPESNFDPSAPPLPPAYSYYSQFSDENTNGYACRLM